LNLDVAVQGNYSFTTHASPLIHDVIYNVTKKIKQTNNETVYDRWMKFAPNKNNTKPLYNYIFSLSNYTFKFLVSMLS
jgi:hypothetical protein